MKNVLACVVTAVILMVAVSVGARADTECVTHYTWKCDDDPNNQCVGYFSDATANTFTEEFVGGKWDLWYVLRFENLPSGTHELRAGGLMQSYQGLSTDEIGNLWKKQKNNCNEQDGFYQKVADFTEDGPSTVTDYALGYSGTTDICIAAATNNAEPSQDEFNVSHATGHYHPVIVTTIPDETDLAASDYITNPGSIFYGDYTNTFTSDNSREVLLEGGPQHRLWHVWRLTGVPSGASHTLYIEGYRPNNMDGDNFKVLYKWSSTCNGRFQQTGLTISSGSEQVLSASFGSGSSSGSLCIAIDDSAGGSVDDAVYIDHLYVMTDDPDCP